MSNKVKQWEAGIFEEYNSFSSAPKGLKEISVQEWAKEMFHYNKSEYKLRQVRDTKNNRFYDLLLFPIPNFRNNPLGLAIVSDWFDPETGKNRPEPIIRFAIYGTDEEWEYFRRKFAAQFAGDDSKQFNFKRS